MDIFEQIAKAKQRERDRERRILDVVAAFRRLSEDERLLALGELTDLVKEVAESLPPAAEPITPTGRSFKLPPKKHAKVRLVPRKAPPPKVNEPMSTATALVRRVMSGAKAPLAIDQILAAVLEIGPGIPRPEIYSAVYKAKKRGEFLIRDDGTYTNNHAYVPSARGRKRAA